MTVTAPPRAPRPSDPVTHGEFDALVEALIEEARQRARRRRRRYGASILLVALAAGFAYFGFDHTGGGAVVSQPDTAGSSGGAASAAPPRVDDGLLPWTLRRPRSPCRRRTGRPGNRLRGHRGVSSRAGTADGAGRTPASQFEKGRSIRCVHGARLLPSTPERRQRCTRRAASRPMADRLARSCTGPRTAGIAGACSIAKLGWSRSVRRVPRLSTPSQVRGTAASKESPLWKQNRLFTSTDGGLSWRGADRGLPTTLWTIAFDPTTPATLYLARGGASSKARRGRQLARANGDCRTRTCCDRGGPTTRTDSLRRDGRRGDQERGRWA